jgi:hypothetical protein
LPRCHDGGAFWLASLLSLGGYYLSAFYLFCLIVYEHSLVREDDSKLNFAFSTERLYQHYYISLRSEVVMDGEDQSPVWRHSRAR